MNMLATLKTDNTIEGETDRLGGGSAPLPSGIYPARIDLAYLRKSAKGALGLRLVMETPTGETIDQTIYLTGGDAKGNNNFYLDKKSGEKKYLPGFLLGQSLALLTLNKEISELDTEKKVVAVYDYEAKKEQPTEVDMVTEFLGKEIWVGLLHQVVDKNVLDEVSGQYVPTGETREENEIDKFFRAADKLTVAEARAQATSPAFFEQWEEKMKGKTRDRSKGAGQGTPGTGAGPAAGGALNGAKPGGTPSPAPAARPTTSLFGGAAG